MNNNDIKNQTENFEIQNSDEDLPVTDDLEDMIEQLPENFPQALPIIQNDIAPIIAECDVGLKDHYISLIRKRTKAASKRAVQLEIENAVILVTEKDLLPAEKPGNPVIDPELQQMAEQIASDVSGSARCIRPAGRFYNEPGLNTCQQAGYGSAGNWEALDTSGIRHATSFQNRSFCPRL